MLHWYCLSPWPPPPPFFSFPGVMEGGWGWVGWEGVEGVTVWWGQVCIPEDHQCFHCPALCSRYHTSWTLQMNPISLRRLTLWCWCAWKGYPFHNPVRWSQQNICRAVLCLVWSKTETEYLVSQMWKKASGGETRKYCKQQKWLQLPPFVSLFSTEAYT